jgi:hypothetical protein
MSEKKGPEGKELKLDNLGRDPDVLTPRTTVLPTPGTLSLAISSVSPSLSLVVTTRENSKDKSSFGLEDPPTPQSKNGSHTPNGPVPFHPLHFNALAGLDVKGHPPGHKRDGSSNSFASDADWSLTSGLKASDQIDLNVGGNYFSTSVATLTFDHDTFFGAMFSGRFPILRDQSNRVFIDRDGTHFRHILNYMREGSKDWDIKALGMTPTEMLQLQKECRFYGLKTMDKLLGESLMAEEVRIATKAKRPVVVWLPVLDTSSLLPTWLAVLAVFLQEGFKVEGYGKTEGQSHMILSGPGLTERGTKKVVDLVGNHFVIYPLKPGEKP